MGYFSNLLPPQVAIAEAAVADATASLYPEELASLAAAVPRRRAEFSTGRKCAREALAELGIAPRALARLETRVPDWPGGTTGSITHTLTHCAVAAARMSDGIVALGIDLEPAAPLPAGLWENICSADELAAVHAGGMTEALAPRLLFGAKEAAFKAQYLVSETMLEFSDLAVSIDAAAQTFTARYQRSVPKFENGHELRGRFRIADAHIACAVFISA